MSSLQDRMDDAEFIIQIPVCNYCKNRIPHKSNPKSPLDPIMTCMVYGRIPRKIDMCETKECPKFIIDKEEAEFYKDFEDFI